MTWIRVQFGNTVEFLIICTPPLSGANFCTLISTCKNEIIIPLFVQQKRKHDEMMQVWRNGIFDVKKCNKHILLAVGVDCTARDTVKVKFTGVRPSILHYIGSSITKPHKTSSESCTACYKSLLCVL